MAFDRVQPRHSSLDLTHLERVSGQAAGLKPQILRMRATPEKAWHQSCPVEAVNTGHWGMFAWTDHVPAILKMLFY